MNNDVTESDLHAYVDGQLDPRRRIEVADYLAAHPTDAAQVMADLRTRDELRMALRPPMPVSAERTNDLARRLGGGLVRQRIVNRFRPAMAAMVMLTIGWTAHSQLGATTAHALGTVPAYVETAVRAHETTQLRAAMSSQPVAPEFDAAEILSATAIAVPGLPGDWQVRDVQVFPSEFGPSVEMAIHAGALGEVSLFAARPGNVATFTAEASRRGDVAAAYWQKGDVAYVLVGDGEPMQLERTARALARSL